MPTIEIKPAVTGDDGHARSDSTFGSSLIRVGEQAPNFWNGWFRFPNVTVPVGATIDVAYLTLTRIGGNSGTVLTKITGIDEDDHVAPTSFAEWDTDHSAHTTAAIDWDFAQASAGTHNSASIVTVIQELIDRGGWASGQAMGIHIDDDSSINGDRQFWEDLEDAGTGEAILHIEYTEAGGGGDNFLILGIR